MVQTATVPGYATYYKVEPTTKISEEELVSMLKEKCDKTFTYLYNNYSAALYGVILDFIGDKDLADDVLQEVFINIYKRIDTYDANKSRLYTWMLNVTRHLSIDTLRSKTYKNFSRHEELSDAAGAIVTSTSSKLENIGLYRMLDKIKPDHKKLIELCYYKGYSQDEISQLLQIPIGTVKTRIRSALVQLRKHIS